MFGGFLPARAGVGMLPAVLASVHTEIFTTNQLRVSMYFRLRVSGPQTVNFWGLRGPLLLQFAVAGGRLDFKNL
jgi:hypothetical protein